MLAWTCLASAGSGTQHSEYFLPCFYVITVWVVVERNYPIKTMNCRIIITCIACILYNYMSVINIPSSGIHRFIGLYCSISSLVEDNLHTVNSNGMSVNADTQ